MPSVSWDDNDQAESADVKLSKRSSVIAKVGVVVMDIGKQQHCEQSGLPQLSHIESAAPG